MSSTSTTSEIMLADKGCGHLISEPKPRVLIGGLGLGYSSEARARDHRGSRSRRRGELIPDVVDWNREFLARVNGGCSTNRTSEILLGDVFAIIRRSNGVYDSILLDVDNGPTSFVQSGNKRLYDRRGLKLIHKALKIGGKVAFWSAEAEPQFRETLSRSGFDVEEFQRKRTSARNVTRT
jgi:spermidine synthase